MAQAPRDVDPAPAAVPVGPDEQPDARPVAPGGLRRMVTGVGVGVVAGLLLLLDLRDDEAAAAIRPRIRGRLRGVTRSRDARSRIHRWVRR